MRKLHKIAAILAVALLLTACSTPATDPGKDDTNPSVESTLPVESTPTEPSQPESQPTDPSAGTTPPTQPPATKPTEPKEETKPSAPTEPKEETKPTAPSNPTEPSQPETQPTEPSQPGVETQPTIPSEPGGETQPTVPSEPNGETTPTTPSEPTVPGRPTSSATGKDTGSEEIWTNPDYGQPDYYEETDPERVTYLQYMVENGNPEFFFLEEEEMHMYLGHTYGMPLITGGEIIPLCTWESSDPTVATVNHIGFVTPLKLGETVITVTYADPENPEPLTFQCHVSVTNEPQYTYGELEQLAHEEAKKIANYAMLNGETDLEKIAIAASLVNIYVSQSRGGVLEEIVDGQPVTTPIPGSDQPFGTLVTHHSTCAGDVRAMGLVLEYMGFEWFHYGEDQQGHQWCIVYDVDGETAFADGNMLGAVGYGERLEDQSNWMQYRDGEFVPVLDSEEEEDEDLSDIE